MNEWKYAFIWLLLLAFMAVGAWLDAKYHGNDI